MEALEIEIKEQDKTIKRLDLFIYGYSFGLILLLYGLVNNIVNLHWPFIIILGLFIAMVFKQLLRTLKILSNPTIIFLNEKMKVRYMKFGKQIAEEHIKKIEIESYRICNNTTFLLNGFAVVIKQFNKDTIIGLALKEEDALRIENAIKNWM